MCGVTVYVSVPFIMLGACISVRNLQNTASKKRYKVKGPAWSLINSLIIGSSHTTSDANTLNRKRLFSRSFQHSLETVNSQQWNENLHGRQWGTLMTHLIHTLPPRMHIHIVNSWHGGQLATPAYFERKQLGVKPSPTTPPLCGTRTLPIYYLCVYLHTTDPFIKYCRAEFAPPPLSSHSFPSISLPATCMTFFLLAYVFESIQTAGV